MTKNSNKDMTVHRFVKSLIKDEAYSNLFVTLGYSSACLFIPKFERVEKQFGLDSKDLNKCLRENIHKAIDLIVTHKDYEHGMAHLTYILLLALQKEEMIKVNRMIVYLVAIGLIKKINTKDKDLWLHLNFIKGLTFLLEVKM